jgi:hypothetical protein
MLKYQSALRSAGSSASYADASIMSVVIACWISVPVILMNDDSGPGPLAGALGGERAQLRVRECGQLDLDRRHALGEALVVEERRRRALLARDRAQPLEQLERTGHAGRAVALVLEQELGVGPAFAFVADAVLDRARARSRRSLR